MAKKTDTPGTQDYSSGVKKTLVLGKDGINMATATNPLPVDAVVTVDSMSITAEMSEASGHDYYVTTTNLGDDTDIIGFDSVAGLVLEDIIKVENKTQGWVYNTKGAVVTATTLKIIIANQEPGTPLPLSTDEFEIVYRGTSRFTDKTQMTNITDGTTEVVVESTGSKKALNVNVTDGTNDMPTLDAVGRAGYFYLTDGTNTANTMDAVGRAGYQYITDGTNTMPTMDATARPGFVTLTDGTSEVDIIATINSLKSDVSSIAGVALVADNAAYPGTDYPVPIGGQYNATAPTFTDGDRVIQQYTSSGKLKVDASLDAELPIPFANFRVGTEGGAIAYTSNVTATLTGDYPAITSNAQLVYVKIIPTAGSGAVYYVSGLNGVTLTISSGVLTINGAGTPFASGDVYELGINAPLVSMDYGLDVQKNSVQNPAYARYVTESVVDTTDVAAATNYYPSSSGSTMDGYKNLSVTGKFIDGDGVITMTIEATNDEDATAANRDWISIYGYDAENDSTVNSMAVTNGTLTFAWDFDNLNYKYYRYKVINNGATNTFIIKQRKSW